MRLLNTKTLRVEEFVDDARRPEYAILSHTWGEEEITIQEIQDLDRVKEKLGFSKIREASIKAETQGYQYIWIDTCCIDKTSSAELSEAINSMYQWYKESNVCYVFLADVGGRENWKDDPADEDIFRCSRWFTRGWTLQELIAPKIVEFYSSTWSFLGTKHELSDFLYSITGIDLYVLNGGDPTHVSVARRMFWASGRQTTKSEDESYCLLGLFNIHMPLLYGEGGRKAFLRLQEEILKISDDQSIFAWFPTTPELGVLSGESLLAKCPANFSHCGEIGLFPYRRTRRNFAIMTEEGMKMNFIVASRSTRPSYALLILDCPIGPLPGTSPSIRLELINQTIHEAALFDQRAGDVVFASPGSDADYEGIDPIHLCRPDGQRRQAILDGDRYPFITQILLPLTLSAHRVQTTAHHIPFIWLQPFSELSVRFCSAHPLKAWDPKTRLLHPESVERLRHIYYFGYRVLVMALEFQAVELEVSFNVLIGCTGLSLTSLSLVHGLWCLLFSNEKETPSVKDIYGNFEFTGQVLSNTSACPALGLAAKVEVCTVSGSKQIFLSIN